MDFTIERKSRNTHTIRWNIKNKKESRFDALLISDLHWDNPHCKRELLKKHLTLAKERNAPVIVVGDFFCLMEGKGDLRSSKNIRPEHNNENYLDSVVNTAADWFEPYKDQLAVVGMGNHETSVVKRHETCMISRFCQLMRTRGGIAQESGYGGWVRFVSNYYGRKHASDMYFHHGFGGGSAATRGTGQFSSHYLNQVHADIVVAGHVHWKESFQRRVAFIDKNAEVQTKLVHCMRLGTYKDEYEDGAVGYHNEGARGARPLGGYWLSFQLDAGRRYYRYVTETIA
jgi:hypothetical protein